MSTKLPLLYSVFGLAGTGGEEDPLCTHGTTCGILIHRAYIWYPDQLGLLMVPYYVGTKNGIRLLGYDIW